MAADTWLAVAVVCLLVVNWTVALTLVRVAFSGPRIAALTERAWLAVLIAAVTTIALGSSVLGFDGGRVLGRVLMIGTSLYPIIWLWTYWTDGFGR